MIIKVFNRFINCTKVTSNAVYYINKDYCKTLEEEEKIFTFIKRLLVLQVRRTENLYIDFNADSLVIEDTWSKVKVTITECSYNMYIKIIKAITEKLLNEGDE